MQEAQEVLSKVTGGAAGHKLPTRKLGRYGPEVTAIGYGTMGLVSTVQDIFCECIVADHLQSAFYGPPMEDEKRFEVLDKVYADGDLFWDSADIYMDSEDLLGEHGQRFS